MPVSLYNETLDTLTNMFRFMSEMGTGLTGEPKCAVYEGGRVVFFLTFEFTTMGRVCLATIERATNRRYNSFPTPWVLKHEASDTPMSGIEFQLEGNMDSIDALVEAFKEIVLNPGNQRWVQSVDAVLVEEGFYPSEDQPDENPEEETLEADWSSDEEYDAYDSCQGCTDTSCSSHPDYRG